MISLVGQALFSSATILLVLSVCFSVFYTVHRKTIVRTSLKNKASFTLWYATLTISASAISTLLLHFPSLSSPIVFAHCHPETCLPHVPETVYSSIFGPSLVAITACLVLLMVIIVVRSILFASQKLTLLTKLTSGKSRLEAGTNYHIVESKDIFAWCAGLIYPRIFVSRGMIDQTNQDQLEVILAHEYCHLQKRDNLRKLLLSWTTLLWLPWQKRQITDDFANFIEEYSDFYASQRKVNLARSPIKMLRTELSVHMWDWIQFLFLIVQFVIAVTIMTSLSHFFVELFK